MRGRQRAIESRPHRFLMMAGLVLAALCLAGCQPSTAPAAAPVVPHTSVTTSAETPTVPPKPTPASPADLAASRLAVTKPYPPLGQASTVHPGVLEYTVTLPRDAGSTLARIYVPTGPIRGKLPCLMIAPTGSRLFNGANLQPADQNEHLTYARAGFAVVAYQTDGALAPTDDPAASARAARAFMDAEAGVANERAALDYALARIPGIDPSRVFAVGDGPAGTVALLAAARDPRIRACAVCAPVCDPATNLASVIPTLDGVIPGYRAFIQWSSPAEHPEELPCPVFLFHADDDDVVPLGEIEPYIASLKATNRHVTYSSVHSGGHYLGTIYNGIPRAVAWMESLPARESAAVSQPVRLHHAQPAPPPGQK